MDSDSTDIADLWSWDPVFWKRRTESSVLSPPGPLDGRSMGSVWAEVPTSVWQCVSDLEVCRGDPPPLTRSPVVVQKAILVHHGSTCIPLTSLLESPWPPFGNELPDSSTKWLRKLRGQLNSVMKAGAWVLRGMWRGLCQMSLCPPPQF